MSVQLDRIEKLKSLVSTHQNFPKPGVTFRNIFPILQDPSAFTDLINLIVEEIKSKPQLPDIIVGLDARGFLIAPIVALRLGIAFVPVRKAGKLPGNVEQVSYKLEYGEDTLEIETGSIKPDQNVVIVDDLIALGGTASAACRLVRKMSATILECISVIELVALNGRRKIDAPVFSVLQY
ncbi:Adenine phosphoribosyltransferase [Trichoplax sp. H2]|uniref:Adenine phosphoribosyltransferase n=1 Tax=Trichoplax adhaerens TaxID=10228 RepID=B3RVF1_TRIAD|nr:hypothetical protein TRIADDRAFT_23778 [Trichoplax adhaerens]EDV25489.1 hypothetical protein TRIADDRAFT_23778 [Trichoplax adhaerens]RDD46984.1 Adenine phosphoribosyltransferase [Trichoplax sp. H2]|eukprot:XP_002111522.1 hypothetical protein TRIADDRAFT_23778 [Trichoplax adhaerens]